MPTPTPRLRPLGPDQVSLRGGVCAHRYELNRQYLLSLKAENLLQNHYFEAGIWGPPGKPGDDIHWGWESPNSMVRGHFVGHWLAAAAQIHAATGDTRLKGTADFIVSELARCQDENGGGWVASIPEKYLHRIARGRLAWAPMYIVSKTLMGLVEMHRLTGSDQAMEILAKATTWFTNWCAGFSRDEMDDILDYETCGMLEVWADLYALTGKQDYLDLMERFDRSRLFDRLVAGDDLLTNRHANTTIPEVIGAARAYEVTGEQRWRDIVDAYWRFAVADRGYYATGGQTSAESWTPPFQQSARLGHMNQEHCTVFNMMRLAEFLLRWTGDVQYADYRERNLWNGVLAQQHPNTGMVTYYLPLHSGAKKTWGTRTDSFWCCYGTLVQAHALHGTGTYFTDDDGLVVTGSVEAEVRFDHQGTNVRVAIGGSAPERAVAPGQANLDDVLVGPRALRKNLYLTVTAGAPVDCAVKVRVPWWVAGDGATVTIAGERIAVEGDGKASSYVTIRRRWEGETVVKIEQPTKLVTVPMDDRPDTVAFMEGPLVLGGLCGSERTLGGDPDNPLETTLIPDNERNPTDFGVRYRTIGVDPGIRFIPLHEIVDEQYTVYFPIKRS